MGSSKKHKEKDKDRDRERRREKERKHRDKDRERDRDTEKEKSSRRREERSREKRGHGSEEDVARVDKKKAKREDYDDLYEYAVEESARDDQENSKLLSGNEVYKAKRPPHVVRSSRNIIRSFHRMKLLTLTHD